MKNDFYFLNEIHLIVYRCSVYRQFISKYTCSLYIRNAKFSMTHSFGREIIRNIIHKSFFSPANFTPFYYFRATLIQYNHIYTIADMLFNLFLYFSIHFPPVAACMMIITEMCHSNEILIMN